MAAILLAPALAFAAPFAGIVMDARTGKVLWESNADARLHPASLTKMLTLYIAFDAIRRGEISQDDMVTVTAHAARQPPSRLGLRAGQKISMRHLIRAAAIKSANDAAAAIGDHLSGSPEAFSQRMNRTAKALGMGRSSFRNAHGLTAEGHLSTARDMNLLGRRLFYDFPEFYSIFSRRTEDVGVAKISNTNRRFLDGYRGADGIKTGYTNPAGFNLTASAERGGKRLIATVFGGTSTAQRNQKISEMLDHGFGNAPANVRSVPPKPVMLDEVASAAAASAAASLAVQTPGGAGKTLRVTTTLAQSPRPQRRPEALSASAVAEVTSGVADVLAGLTAPEPPPFAVTELAAAELPAEVPEALTPSTAESLAEASQIPTTEVPTTQPRARPSALASLVASEADPAAIADLAALSEESSEEPEEAIQQVAETAPPAADPVADPVVQLAVAAPASPPLPFQMVGTDGSPQPVSAADQNDPELPDDLPSPSAEDGEEMPALTQLASALVVPELLSPSETARRPRKRPGEIVMTMASADAATPTNVQRTSASGGEVVSRVSTSGGRHWAVTLGKYNNRGTAERALLQTALSETRALEGSLRKVTSRGSGYEAIFAGLTRDQADLVCRRLQARAMSCFTLGP